MKKHILLLCFLYLVSCSSDDSLPIIAACDVANPIEDLEWLKAEVEKRKNDTSSDAIYCYIEQAITNERTIFIYNDCNPLIDKVIPVYSCSGEVIGLLGEENFDSEAISSRTVIYRPSDFACELN
jgi:hypothetical protein